MEPSADDSPASNCSAGAMASLQARATDMSKFAVELEVLKRHIAEAEMSLEAECENAGAKDHPEFLPLRRVVRELHRTIDALHAAIAKR